LHDSAQQRLVALRVHLTLAQERRVPEPQRRLLEQVSTQVDEALKEIRAVARGEYPSRLNSKGLVAALEDVATRLSPRVEVRNWGTSRHDRSSEQAVYYCCMEAIQNALKHAGSDARITVSVGDRGDGLYFVVEDDGRGFDTKQTMNGQGLSNMAARLEQVGGEVSIQSRPGAGTRVSGSTRT
jgi:signal transduction histidine kinase